MPILTASPIKVIDREEFHRVDRLVTGMAFDIHNQFGRYLDESLYQRELARRLRVVGHDVILEYEMTAQLDNFSKHYFADLLIDSSVIVETKTVSTLTNAHRGQTLNYMYMCDLRHATLLNFRSQRVEHEFVSTGITPSDRYRYQIHDDAWSPRSAECSTLKDLFLRCVSEWGVFLDPSLYQDALVHFLGGKSVVERSVPVVSEGFVLGTQTMRMLNDNVAFSVTTSVHHPEVIYEHQRRFISHTSLKALHWFNLNHHRIEVRTITQ